VVAFLIRKPHDVLLVPGTLRLITRYALSRHSNRLTSKNEVDKALGHLVVRADGGDDAAGCSYVGAYSSTISNTINTVPRRRAVQYIICGSRLEQSSITSPPERLMERPCVDERPARSYA
jgi:hypothetical protein